jgi:hypothetical protein
MNMVACLFPYKNGYHLDMYAVFTEKEGGLLEWPRRFTGRLMGTPETWTDQTMVDVVRSIRDSTGAQVALVEAKPALAGTPWLEMGPRSPAPAGGGAPAGSGTATTPNPAGSDTGTAGGTGAAGGVTSAAAPSASGGIAPIASTPAASSTENPSPSTVATSGSESKETKTDVK